MKKFRILHVTTDSVFFNSVYAGCEASVFFENKAIVVKNSKDCIIEHIRKSEDIEFLYGRKRVRERLRKDDYDIVYFHSLPREWYNYLKYITDSKIVIWWAWGFELYSGDWGLMPLIQKDLYMPQTRQYLQKSFVFTKIKKYVCYIYKPIVQKRRNRVINRIDYFQPVLKTEYEWMLKNFSFRAKEFYLFPTEVYKNVTRKKADGSILLGNSATVSNNHLDCFVKIMEFKQNRQKVIIPLSYGSKDYTKWLRSFVEVKDVVPIYDFLPQEAYFEILDSCSYAVIGTIRQQALGNIYYLLSKGTKVFLYKESMAYHDLIACGYAVYAIEDMNDNSLFTPLTDKEIAQNVQASYHEHNRREEVLTKCLTEIRIRLGLNN